MAKAPSNWQYLGRYRDALLQSAVELIQLFPPGASAKNGADIKLCLDATEDISLRDPTLDDAELQRAIAATFARRQTATPSATPIGLSDAFADDATKQTQWRAFLNKNKLEPMDLRDVIRAIRERVLLLGFRRS